MGYSGLFRGRYVLQTRRTITWRSIERAVDSMKRQSKLLVAIVFWKSFADL